jgi:hypothetical protein
VIASFRLDFQFSPPTRPTKLWPRDEHDWILIFPVRPQMAHFGERSSNIERNRISARIFHFSLRREQSPILPQIRPIKSSGISGLIYQIFYFYVRRTKYNNREFLFSLFNFSLRLPNLFKRKRDIGVEARQEEGGGIV